MPATSKSSPAVWIAAIALVAGGLAWFLRTKPVAAPMPTLDIPDAPSTSSERSTAGVARPEPTGGVFGGIVVDAKGAPVKGADVFLAGKRNRVAKLPNPILSDDPKFELPDLEVQQIDYETVARVTTGPDGRFRAAAGDSVVVALFALESAHAPGLLASNPPGNGLAPGPDHTIVVADAGWLKGRVVDAVTKEPVAGADVALNLQTRTSQGDKPGPEPWTERNGFAAFQGYVSRELAPLVWQAVPIQGDPSVHRYTQSDGAFTFGPVMSEVQIDVVVSHPDYAWTDSDPEVTYREDNETRKEGQKPLSRKRRLVVPPGQTVERTWELVKGREVKGRVEDNLGHPIPDVLVQLSHIAQYAQHPWYRDHTRNARTDSDGRFRIAGLSYPPYALHMDHPSFGVADFSGVEADSDKTYKIEQAGWISGEVSGGTIDRPLYEAILTLDPYSGLVQRARLHVTVKDGRFEAKNVPPGRYAASLVAGPWISAPTDVAVESGKPSSYVARLQSGGTVSISAVDSHGAVIDPFSADLEVVGTDGRSLRGAGAAIGRKGTAVATSLAAGRYRARLHAPWYAETLTEPFDVAGDKTTALGPFTLRKYGWIRIQSVKDARGQLPQDVRIELAIAQGGADYAPVRTGDAGLVPVTAGTVKLKAEASDGRRFEQTYEVGEGETVPADVRIQ